MVAAAKGRFRVPIRATIAATATAAAAPAAAPPGKVISPERLRPVGGEPGARRGTDTFARRPLTDACHSGAGGQD